MPEKHLAALLDADCNTTTPYQRREHPSPVLDSITALNRIPSSRLRPPICGPPPPDPDPCGSTRDTRVLCPCLTSEESTAYGATTVARTVITTFRPITSPRSRITSTMPSPQSAHTLRTAPYLLPPVANPGTPGSSAPQLQSTRPLQVHTGARRATGSPDRGRQPAKDKLPGCNGP